MAEDQQPRNSLSHKYLTSLPPVKKLIEALLAELVGTFLLEFFGCLSLILNAPLLQVAVGWGFIVGHIIQIFGPISGAHINPGVSLANIILGNMSLALASMYVIMQFIGALLGYLSLKFTLPKSVITFSSKIENGNEAFCCTLPGEDVTEFQALVIEYFGTCFLIYIVCSINDPRNRFFRDSIPLKVAICISADVICIGHLTGASLNTARSFAPALVTHVWRSHWVYWVGPLLAGLTTPMGYLLCFQRNLAEEDKQPTFQDLVGKMK